MLCENGSRKKLYNWVLILHDFMTSDSEYMQVGRKGKTKFRHFELTIKALSNTVAQLWDQSSFQACVGFPPFLWFPSICCTWNGYLWKRTPSCEWVSDCECVFVYIKPCDRLGSYSGCILAWQTVFPKRDFRYIIDPEQDKGYKRSMNDEWIKTLPLSIRTKYICWRIEWKTA